MNTHTLLIVILFSFGNIVDTQCYSYKDTSQVRARVESGWVCGTNRHADNGVMYASFRGIPYAEQPIGENRFKELRPKEPWEGCYDARNEGPICPQIDDLYGNMVYPYRSMSEECIRVNVHVPHVSLYSMARNEINTEAKLPILVFIHGGGFQVGSGDSDLNGPEYLVSKGVIVITFNYRLNVFGFLSLNSPAIPGNNGLRDMLTLLRWVQTNAKAFGGDSDRVTLAGQSAGAAAAHLLSLSLQAKGLFKRVILMSGTAIPSFYSASPIYAQFVANLFLTTLGINSTDPAYIHQQLTQMSLSEIMNANQIVQFETGLVSFVPVVESEHLGVMRVLDDDPIALLERGRGKEFPLVVGFTSKEAEFFKRKLIKLQILARIARNPAIVLAPRYAFELSPNVSLPLAKKVQDRYFKGTPTLEATMELFTDTFFKYPGFLLSRMREAVGAPVYLYYYTYEANYNTVKLGLSLDYRGAAHVEDLTFVFRENAILGDKILSPETRDDYMKEWMTSIVVNFMTCSDPSCSKGLMWPPSVNLTYQLIDVPTVYITTPPSYDQYKMVKFFDAINQKSRIATGS